MKLLEQPTDIRYVLAKPLKCIQIRTQRILIKDFYKGLFEMLKGLGTSFQTTFFISECSLVMLRKLCKFHYQTVFTSQVIQ